MRRLLCSMLAATALAGAAPVAVIAAEYPERTINMIVPFDAGGSADLVGRILAAGLRERLGQAVVVDNRPGAGGAIGTSAAARSTADGYTLLFGTISTHALNVAVYPRLPYDPVADFEPIIQFGTVPYVLVVPASINVRTLSDFIAYARADNRFVTYGSAGVGTANHLAGALLATRERLNGEHVPYRGGAQAITGLLRGEITYMFYPYLALLPHIREGNVRALAITNRRRIGALPDVPTMAEAGMRDFELSGFFALYAPRGTPAEVVRRVHRAAFETINTPAVQEQLLAQGVDPVTGTSEDLGRLMRSEIDRWRPVVEAAGARQQ